MVAVQDGGKPPERRAWVLLQSAPAWEGENPDIARRLGRSGICRDASAGLQA
ncbi:hypothetical protein [Methanoculleus frigidifontis]|uniref:hypothetical protein n=1 Tax=Methanoculleus frigidifontis TaxID=2584085 RepID=UPI0026584E0F|nr:hypothetical protein [Methanoculleus sp. FWC-SCC1]